MSVGGILEVGFRRISGFYIVGKETVGRTVLKAEQGLVCDLPECGISRTEADTEKSRFDDGTGVELVQSLKPTVCHVGVSMRGPAAGEQEIDIEKQLTGTLLGVVSQAPETWPVRRQMR